MCLMLRQLRRICSCITVSIVHSAGLGHASLPLEKVANLTIYTMNEIAMPPNPRGLEMMQGSDSTGANDRSDNLVDSSHFTTDPSMTLLRDFVLDRALALALWA